MGTGKGLLDSLIAEGGVKSRDLSWAIIIMLTLNSGQIHCKKEVRVSIPNVQ